MCEKERVQCTVQGVQPDWGHHYGQAISRTAARTVLVYSECIEAYIQGLYNTVRVLGSVVVYGGTAANRNKPPHHQHSLAQSSIMSLALLGSPIHRKNALETVSHRPWE
jgi:hypothetical protein